MALGPIRACLISGLPGSGSKSLFPQSGSALGFDGLRRGTGPFAFPRFPLKGSFKGDVGPYRAHIGLDHTLGA